MQSAFLLLIVFMVVLTLITKPLGLYMVPFCEGRCPRFLQGCDKLVLKLFRTENYQQSWVEYTVYLLFFNFAGLVVLYLLQRLQGFLPYNPEGLEAIEAFQALNTAISFVTNTNWQSYSGEATMSYLTQMAGLAVQNFVSAATGICVAFVVIRSFSRKETKEVGNFLVDLVHITLYVLLPICFIYALFLVSQGVLQNFSAYKEIVTLAGDKQVLAMGPVASQEAIKLIGTNGGGFFNANSSHPFENPTELSNFFECLSIFAISAALTYTFGYCVKDTRQGWVFYGAMAIMFIIAVSVVIIFESQSTPDLLAAGADPSFMNMEGKEVRFDLGHSSLFTVVTTSASCGAVNNMHDSLTPIAGSVPLLLMALGEVVYGGVGSGFYGMMIFAIIAVFIAGLMVGRTPEYLGKKIAPRQMKLACIGMLTTPLIVLLGAAITCFYPVALDSLNNPSAHGLTEYLYAWVSAANNNGSAFAGLNANTPFFNIGLGIAMWLGRFVIIASIMALSGSLVTQKIIPPTSGTLPTSGILFMFLLVGTVFLVGALTYIPSLALGPIAEHLTIWAN